MEKPYAIGIDIGAQSAKIGVVNRKGDVLERAKVSTKDTTEFDVFLENLVEKGIKPLLTKNNIDISQIQGVGVGAPNASYKKGTIEQAANLVWGKDPKYNGIIPFVEKLKEKVGVRCVLTNDANATALGEMQYGAARGMKDFIEITLGSGVGSGIVINGQLLYGHDSFAGELGHTTVVRAENARVCGCGKKGCLEAYTSAVGLARTAREILENTDVKSSLRKYEIDEITSKEVSEEAKKGDEFAKEVYNRTCKMLGETFADFVAFSAPEAIILFGGMTGAGEELLLPPIKEALQENLFKIWRGRKENCDEDKIKVIFSSLPDNDAAILGASALAW
ncbi:MAG: ROK family protein [Prevotellaceae bacterium]|jgi:glucokinase|nr:ROK family protein [Prevotellaceae bacterium]